jgi:hypothetical protein
MSHTILLRELLEHMKDMQRQLRLSLAPILAEAYHQVEEVGVEVLLQGGRPTKDPGTNVFLDA